MFDKLNKLFIWNQIIIYNNTILSKINSILLDFTILDFVILDYTLLEYVSLDFFIPTFINLILVDLFIFIIIKYIKNKFWEIIILKINLFF